MKTPCYYCTDDGYATCILDYNGYKFIGEAQCHPEDMDVMSKLTGYNIAEMRATLEFLRYIRDIELGLQLKSLYQLYYSMSHSKNYNKKSYEAKMLYRQINRLETDLAAVKEEIDNVKQTLKKYLEQKEKDHAKIREVIAKRELVENNQESCE
jgi:hypothetical protein